MGGRPLPPSLLSTHVHTRFSFPCFFVVLIFVTLDIMPGAVSPDPCLKNLNFARVYGRTVLCWGYTAQIFFTDVHRHLVLVLWTRHLLVKSLSWYFSDRYLKSVLSWFFFPTVLCRYLVLVLYSDRYFASSFRCPTGTVQLLLGHDRISAAIFEHHHQIGKQLHMLSRIVQSHIPEEGVVVGVQAMVSGLTLQEQVSGLQSSCAEFSATLDLCHRRVRFDPEVCVAQEFAVACDRKAKVSRLGKHCLGTFSHGLCLQKESALVFVCTIVYGHQWDIATLCTWQLEEASVPQSAAW